MFVSADAAVVQVYVSIPPQKQFVERIGGDRVNVRVMLQPGETPETFTPTPRLLTELSGTTLYFRIGVPFENSWMKSLQSLNPDMNIVECCNHLIEPEILAQAVDMHVWTSPDFVRRHARDILDALIAVDPAGSDEYTFNFRGFLREVEGLDVYIGERLATRHKHHFIVSHASWWFFAARYGLVQVALETNGWEAGPRSVQDIIALAQREKISTLFIAEQQKNPYLPVLAAEIGASIEEIDPLAEDYFANMRLVVEKLSQALQ